jgi:signal transduction histidine kinase
LQDRDLENTRSRERRQQAADRLASLVQASLNEPEVKAGAASTTPALPPGSLLITLAGADLSINKGSLVVDVVRALVTDFQSRVAPAGFRIELSAPGAPVHTSADREALSRALGNLLDNAIKYSPECRTVWVGIARQAGRVAISVRDEGIGIPNEERRHIFDRFVRGAEPKAMRIRGTGIGLAMLSQVLSHQG